MAYSGLTNLTSWWHSTSGHCERPSTLTTSTPRSASTPTLHRVSSPAATASTHCRTTLRTCCQKSCPSRQSICRAAHAAGDHVPAVFDVNSADANQLQTALNRAIAAEDYVLASKVRDKLQTVVGGDTGTADWRQLGVPEWLADRAERMGFKYATGLPCMQSTCICLL